MSLNQSNTKNDEKKRNDKRQKQLRKMTKILGKAWQFKDADKFHECPNSNIGGSKRKLDLQTIGQTLDQEGYRHGRDGWEDYARDLGSVYNHFIHHNV